MSGLTQKQMAEELANWNIKAIKDQCTALKISTIGLKEALVTSLAAHPQMKPLLQTIMADPARRYNPWLITSLKAELVRRGIASSGSREDLYTLLLADIEEKSQAAGSANKENHTNPVIDSIIHQFENVSLSQESPSSRKGTSPSRASPSKAQSTPPPRQPLGSRSAQSPASSNASPTVSFKDKTPTGLSPARLSVIAGSPSKKETSPLFSKRSPVPAPVSDPMPAPSTPIKTPAPTPVKGILSPRSKGKQFVPGSASKRVILSHVEVRQYKLCHGGSLGMPHRGGFPIGLDWHHDPAKVVQSPLPDWERIREQKRRSIGELTPLSESERKERIKRHQGALDANHMLELEALEIRNSRTKVGCDCEGDECGTEKCLCFSNGISCSQDACDCAPCDCTNPARDEFDSEKVNQLRRQKIEEANRPPPQQNLSKLFSLTRLLQRSDSLLGGGGANSTGVSPQTPITSN